MNRKAKRYRGNEKEMGELELEKRKNEVDGRNMERHQMKQATMTTRKREEMQELQGENR